MIVSQWAPPWRQLTAACKHSRSIIKGKAPENCICQRIPARHASVWTHLAFAGGEGAAPSASTSTSTSFSPGIGFLFFYPSFHFDIPHVKSRHIKLIKRALRRSLGLSRSLLPIASTSTQQQHQIFSERTSTARRHISHTSTAYSASTSQEEHNTSNTSSDSAALFPSTRPRRPPSNSWQSRSSETDSDIATTSRRASETDHLALTDPHHAVTSSSRTAGRLEGTEQHRQTLITRRSRLQVHTHAFDTLVARVYELIDNRADLKRIRWRLYALLRAVSTKYELKNIKMSEFRHLVGRVCDMHEHTNDSRSLEEIIRRTEVISRRFHAGLVPRRAYQRLLRTYTRAFRANDAFNLLRKMQTMNLQTKSADYVNFITMYAHLKEPEKARMIIETMRREDVPVDQRAFASLMNAYVEAGLWDDAIDLFEYLDSHPAGHPLNPDLYTCTTLMKCYILMGAPLDEVINVFNLMQSRGIRPSKKTYTQVLHAACEAGALDFAEEIFVKLDEEEGKREGANVVAFSVMIRGMLRTGRHDVANEYYQELKRRGLTPTSATWSILLQAYAAAGKPETNAILSELLQQYLDIYLDTRTGNVRLTSYQDDKAVARGTALENVYGPVISSLAKGSAQTRPAGQLSGEIETLPAARSEQAAVNMFKNMLDYPGSKPSLHLYTALLDAYRRVGNTAGVDTLWESIVEYATDKIGPIPDDLASEGEISGAIPLSKRNLLCLPLSVYMDAMSRQHLHQKVAEAWASVQNMGFGFDVGNWNHLIAAFIRAGDLERAFWIAEELLRDAQNFERNKRMYRYGKNTDHSTAQSDNVELSSFIEPDQQTILDGDKAETPMRPPNRTWQYHRNRKDEIYARQADLMLNNQEMPSSTTQHQGESSAQQSATSSISLPQDTLASSMTASYDILRQQHHAQTWVLFSTTVSMLDEILRQEGIRDLERPDGSQNDSDSPVRRNEASRLRHYDRSYPLTMGAIEQYRGKMRKFGLRAYA